MLLVGIWEASDAPAADPIKAGNAIATKTLGSGLIWRRYNAAAVVVPKTEANLFVPSTVTVSVFGRPISKAGSCINPPPPAIESTNPAKNDAQSRNNPVVTVKSANTFLS